MRPGNRIARSTRSISIVALGCLIMDWIPGPGLAQQLAKTKTASGMPSETADGTPPAKRSNDRDGGTMEDMLLTVRRLEERVKELEAKLIRTSDAPPVATAVKAVREDVKPEAVRRQEEKQNDGIMSFFRSTELSGFVDAYFGYNFNHPGVDTQLRNFDTKSSQFSLNMAKVALEKKPVADSRLGFRTDLTFGPAAEIVHASEPGGADVFSHIQQAYLSYLAPVGKGLQIDVGKFVTPHGAEVIETKDNWNYSRSLLFALAIPYYHFGMRATYAFNDKFTLAGYLVNGWNNVVDNNTGKTVGILATVKPTAKLTVVGNYMAGPEQLGNNDDWRHLFDTTVTYAVNGRLSLMANYDYGFDRIAGARVHWQGIAGYFRVQANKWLAFAPRFEWYDDHDGFTTGAPQTVKDFTITSEHKINNGLLTRFEYRKDFSDKHFFIKPFDRLVRAQSTLSFGLVYAFSSKGE